MLMILGFILLFLIMIIGGDRGVISLISLVGNMLLLSLAICAGGGSPRVQKSCSPVHGGYRFFLPLFHHSFFQSMRTRDTKKATELKNQVSGYAQEMVWNTGTIWMAMET